MSDEILKNKTKNYKLLVIIMNNINIEHTDAHSVVNFVILSIFLSFFRQPGGYISGPFCMKLVTSMYAKAIFLKTQIGIPTPPFGRL